MTRRNSEFRTIRRRRLRLVGVIAFFSIAYPAASQTTGPTAIDRLRTAIEMHPDDPDLAWALTRKLASAGRTNDAMSHTQGFLARWPEKRPHARIEIARSMLDAGDATRALVLLDEAVQLDPTSGVARFYRGMAYRASGRIVESNREFDLASQLEPTLRSESFLARALGLFELGRDADAVDLLRQILEIDPYSESAIRARLMLRQREILSMQSPWQVDAYAGFEWDSNVLLESAESESVGTGRADFSGIWGLGIAVRALTADRGTLTLGYRYDQSKHNDLGRFDLLTNSGFASGNLQLSQNALLRLDAIVWNTRQSGHNEVTAGAVRPNLIFALGPDWGALRLFAQYEIFEYEDPALFSAWERDGYSIGGGLEHFLPLPLPLVFNPSFLSTSASFQRNVTQADTTGAPDGFDGDYDYDSVRVRTRATLMLPGKIRAGLEAAYSNDRYHNDNFLNALENLTIEKRRDDVASARVELDRELIPHVTFQAYWRGTWRMSNISFYDYDEQVIGALVRVSLD